jgi:hypothetical protein
MSADGCLEEIVSLDDLVDRLAHHERFGAQVALAAAQLNVSGVWAADGALSMAAWLKQHARLSHRDASRLVREGTFLNTFDHVAAAAVAGALSASQVTAIRAVVSKPTAELFEEHQAGVIDAITGLSAKDSETVCQAWQAKAEAVVEMPEPKQRDRSWSTSQLPDGSVFGKFVFDKTAAEILEAALETARCWDGANDSRTPSMRNADAIVEILGFFNNNNDTRATRRHHPHVELVIELGPQDNPAEPGGNGRHPGDPVDLFGGREPGPEHEHDRVGGCAVTVNGRMLDSWATDAFLCDCVIHKVLRSSAGKILDYGRSHHTVPPRLWKAVAVRDRGCRFPGCDRKKAWTDAHHIRWWRRHGETKLENLLLLCQRHHHMVHQYDWHIELDADTGRVTFTLPNGTVMISEPPGQPTIRAA